MNTDKKVFDALLQSGLKGVKDSWHVGNGSSPRGTGNAPPLPWFVFKRARNSWFKADNSAFECFVRYRAELWMAENDETVRSAFEQALLAIGPFSTNEGWVASENAYQVEYSFTCHPESEE